jgi:hypothetical protein
MELEHFVPIRVDRAETDGAKPIQHYYKVALIEQGRETILTGPVTARAIPNWFAWNRLNNLILMIVLCGSVLFFIEWAKRNPNLFIRRLTGWRPSTKRWPRDRDGQADHVHHGLSRHGPGFTIAR